MTSIHATALVAEQAVIGHNVTIGPFCVIGPHVTLHDNVVLKAHVYIDGYTTIGADTIIYPYAVLGTPPQHLSYKDEPAYLHIGQRNQIREHVTIHPGMVSEKRETIIGDDCFFMVGAHVAHDCRVGNHVILTNQATLGGSVVVDDHVIIGGLSAVHQHVRIGAHAMIGGMSGVENDVIPYGLVMGERAHLSGLNLVGLERRGFARDDINRLRAAYRVLFAPEGTFAERLEQAAEQFTADKEVMRIIDFIRTHSRRALCQPSHA